MKQTVKLPKIIDTKATHSHGILLLNQQSLQEIFVNSGSNATNNEFQAHYWALVFRHIGDDGAILDIAIPTVFFNYPQTVSAARIDFDMKDVHAMSEKVKPVHSTKAAELLKTNIQSKLQSLFNCKFEPVSVNLCSIHRHPGGSAHQAFSGTDLDKRADEHGVVFPYKKADSTPNFASIMAIDNGTCNLAHSEYRIATGELGKDLHYEQNRSCAISVAIKVTSTVEKLFNQHNTRSHETREVQSLVTDDQLITLSSIISQMPKPYTNFVLPVNVKKKIYTPYQTKVSAVVPVEDKIDVIRFTKLELHTKTRAELIKILAEIDMYFDLTIEDNSLFSDEELITSIIEGYAEIDVELVRAAQEKKEEAEDELLDIYDYSEADFSTAWQDQFFRA